MSEDSEHLVELRRQKYNQEQVVGSLQRAFYEHGDRSVLTELIREQGTLYGLQGRIAEEMAKCSRYAASRQDAQGQPGGPQTLFQRGDVLRDGGLRDYPRSGVTRGLETTGLEVEVSPRMEYVPTAIYHLLDQNEHPLVECRIRTNSRARRRLRIVSYVEGYSAQAVKTIELSSERDEVISLLPTLFPDRVQHVHELTRATLNVLAEDLDRGIVETHITAPIWLLSRNSAPLAVRDPATGGVADLSRFLGAFVTPNQARVLQFLREAVEYHPAKRLDGAAGDDTPTLQAKAIFGALKEKAGIAYVNSPVCFGPDEGATSQRVRLPRESLEERQANCLDGALLFASLLEAISVNPAIVVIPKHAFVGWELGRGSDQWQYLETTKMADGEFDAALATGKEYAETFQPLQANAEPGEMWFRRLSLRELRTRYHITPME